MFFLLSQLLPRQKQSLCSRCGKNTSIPREGEIEQNNVKGNEVIDWRESFMMTFTATAGSSNSLGRMVGTYGYEHSLCSHNAPFSSRKEIMKGNRSQFLSVFMCIYAFCSSAPKSSLYFNGSVVSLLTYLVRSKSSSKGGKMLR